MFGVNTGAATGWLALAGVAGVIVAMLEAGALLQGHRSPVIGALWRRCWRRKK